MERNYCYNNCNAKQGLWKILLQLLLLSFEKKIAISSNILIILDNEKIYKITSAKCIPKVLGTCTANYLFVQKKKILKLFLVRVMRIFVGQIKIIQLKTILLAGCKYN